MNSIATLDFAIALVEIGFISWSFIAGHYEARPSDFNFILERKRDRMIEWRASMHDLPDTFVFAAWPYLLVGGLSVAVAEFVMFLPLMIAFMLLHIIAAICYWLVLPTYLRPVRLTIVCAQVSLAVTAMALDKLMHYLSIIRAYVKAKQPEIQYAMRPVVTRLIQFQQDRAGRAHVVRQSLKKAMAPEVDLIRAGMGLVQKYVKLRMSEFKPLVAQLMTPEPEHYQKLVEAELKRALRQHITNEHMLTILHYVELVLLAIKRALQHVWSTLIIRTFNHMTVRIFAEIPATIAKNE